MAQNIGSIVRVRSEIASSAGSAGRRFGGALLVTTDDTLDAGGPGKVQTYSALTEMEDVFDSASEPYQAGLRYFSQTPFPPPLKVARWAATAQGNRVRGGPHATLSALQNANAGGRALSVNGTAVTVGDLSGDAALSDIAATVQAAIRATGGIAGASDYTVAYDPARAAFVLTAGFQGGDPRALAYPTGALATSLGWTEDAGGSLRQGSAVETFSGAIGAISEVDDDWYFVVLDDDITDTAEAESAAGLGRLQQPNAGAGRPRTRCVGSHQRNDGD